MGITVRGRFISLQGENGAGAVCSIGHGAIRLLGQGGSDPVAGPRTRPILFHGEGAFGNFQVKIRPDRVPAHMPHANGHDHRFDPHALQGPPGEGDPLIGQLEFVAAASFVPQAFARPLHRQHGIVSAFLQGGGFLDRGKSELGGIREFFVFFVFVGMLPGVVPGGIGYDLTVFPVSCQKQAHLLIQEYFRRRIGLFLRLPKGMAFWQGRLTCVIVSPTFTSFE